jgi:hypothetical protein
MTMSVLGNLGNFPGVDTIYLVGVPCPGQAIVQPCQKIFGWQIQQGYALSGATCFPKGDELMVIPVLFRLWDPNDYAAFLLYRRQFLKKAVVSPSGSLASFALGIVHPEVNELGVTSVVVGKSPILTNNGKGLWHGQGEFLQYRKPVPALSKPPASLPGAAVATANATTQTQKDIAATRAQINAARDP